MERELNTDRSQIHQNEAECFACTSCPEQPGHSLENDYVHSNLSSPEDITPPLKNRHGAPWHEKKELDKAREKDPEEADNARSYPHETIKLQTKKESGYNQKKRKDEEYRTDVQAFTFSNTVSDVAAQNRLKIEDKDMLSRMQTNSFPHGSREINGCRPKQNIPTKNTERECKLLLDEQKQNESRNMMMSGIASFRSQKGIDKSEVATELLQSHSQLKIRVKRASQDEDYLKDFLESLAEAFTSRSSSTEVLQLFDTSKENYFFETVEKYLVDMIISIISQKPEVKSVERVLLNILCIIGEQISMTPSRIFIFRKLHAILGNVIEELSKIDSVNEDILFRFQYLSELIKKKERKQEYRSIEHYDEKLEGDFRQLSVSPTADEITNRTDTLVRPNRIDGPYEDLDEYLDVHFRLLREDFVAPLRNGMTSYIQMMTSNRENQNTKENLKNLDIRVYENVRVYSPVLTPHGLCYKLRIRMTASLSRIQWKFSKRLIYGSMVCLTDSDFQRFFLATIVEREDQNIKHGFFTVHFVEDNVNTEDVLHKTFRMTETTGYFESYKYVLSALQSFKAGDVPFEKYIVKCQTKPDPPAYLTPKKTFDFTPLVYKEAQEQSSRDNVSEKPKELSCEHLLSYSDATNEVCVMDLKNWPSKEVLQMDKSQYDALQNALTSEFAIIQGPPGTGKTYIGLQIMKVLLYNKSSWSRFRHGNPMLVVCYTNHALDQFLEGIVKFCKADVLRVGGRSKSSELKGFNLTAYRTMKDAKGSTLARLKFDMRQARRSMAFWSGIVQRLALTIEVYQSQIVREDNLLPEMGTRLYDNLKTGYRGNLKEQDFSYIAKWLEIGKIEKECAAHIQNEVREKRKNLIEVDNETDRMKQDRMIDTYDDFVFHPNEQNVLRSIGECIAFNIPEIKKSRQESNDCRRKYLKKLKSTLIDKISNDDIMSQEEADKIDNVWELNYEAKWRLYRRWIQNLCTTLYNRIEINRKNFEDASKRYCKALEQVDKEIMEQASVIGMTTSGAARYQSILREISPSIIVVEEAAEVLEAHVITTLSKGCEHLILIGDHKQLRPNPTVYKLAVKYYLDVSLFERMVRNGIKYSCLELQHRMRPEISSIMKHIYPELKDHEHVKSYPCVKGVSTNLFLINHSNLESTDVDIKSYSNRWEAEYAVALCRYLLLQGYESHEITVLTTYTGQLMRMKDLMPRDEFDGVKVTVVDNYQGEENEIVILSLVRSNTIDKIGFLKTENRICVALSRAKVGFFILGNFDHLAKHSTMWKEIVDDMEKKSYIGERLVLHCQNHPNDDSIKAKEPEDFKKAPEGGCRRKCNIRLNCGHTCERYCHVLDQIHETDKSRCKKPCTKTCELGHKCPYKCFIECLPCQILVTKTIPKCGHSQFVPCGQNPEEFSCEAACEKTLKCCHPCKNLCGMEHTNRCLVLINFTWSCGHTAKIICWQREFLRCPEPCKTTLKCGHICGGTCRTCYMGRIHQSCKMKVTKTLECGHTFKGYCQTHPDCTEICGMSCDHSICRRRCWEPCVPCTMPCTWRCQHYACTKLCSEACNRPRCNQPCNQLLLCKHKCIGLCGEPCPALCRQCDRKRFDHIVFGWKRTPNSRYVLIENCGHLVEALTMDKYMLETKKKNKLGLKFCPVCKTVIRKCRRYGNILKQISITNERKKIEAIEEMNFLQDLQRQVLKFSPVNIDDMKFQRDIENGSIERKEALSVYPCHYFRWKCKKEFEDRVKDVNRRVWTKNECSAVHEQISFALEIIDLRQGILDNERKMAILKSEVEQRYISFLYELLLNVIKPRYFLTTQETEDFKGEIQRGRAFMNLLKRRSEMQSIKDNVDEILIPHEIQSLPSGNDRFPPTKEINRSFEHFPDLTNKTGNSQARIMKSKGVSFAFVGKCKCDNQLSADEDKSFHCCVGEIEFGLDIKLENKSRNAEFENDEIENRSTEVNQGEERTNSVNELSSREINKNEIVESVVCAAVGVNADEFKAKKSTPTVIDRGSDFTNFAGDTTFGDFTRSAGTDIACLQTSGGIE